MYPFLRRCQRGPAPHPASCHCGRALFPPPARRRRASRPIGEKESALDIYVNGKHADTTVLPSSKQQLERLKIMEAAHAAQRKAAEAKAEASKDGKKEKASKDGKKEEKKEEKKEIEPPPEQLCIDPSGFALLPLMFGKPDAGDNKKEKKEHGKKGDDKTNKGDDAVAERVRVKYLKVDADQAWDAKQVAAEVRTLRGRDEDKELATESGNSQAKQLTLGYYYQHPVPIWHHPVFAGEFADAFICGSSLESGAFDMTLTLMSLAVKTLLDNDVVVSTLLASRHRNSLSRLSAHLEGALDIYRAMVDQLNTDLSDAYLVKILRELDGLEPGCTTMLPCLAARETPFVICVERYTEPYASRCTVTIIANDAALLKHHRAHAEPPKIKYETALELLDVSFTKLCDEGLWDLVWHGVVNGASGAQADVKREWLARVHTSCCHEPRACTSAYHRGRPAETPFEAPSRSYAQARRAISSTSWFSPLPPSDLSTMRWRTQTRCARRAQCRRQSCALSAAPTRQRTESSGTRCSTSCALMA